MPPKIRILVVDDSVVVRRLITRILAEDGVFEVVGFAANGEVALAQEKVLQPDVITMDVDMPVMSGLEAVRALRARRSKAIVIMCSSFTSLGDKATIEALVLGANDYINKSDLTSSVAIETLKADLQSKLQQFFPDRVRQHSELPKPALPAIEPTSMKKSLLAMAPQARSILAIGVSTGGPTALMRLLPALPADFPVPIVVVQHMPPIFTEQLAARLNAESSLEVLEASQGMKLASGRVILAPGNWHMRLKRVGGEVQVCLDQGERENSCRPSVDVLFSSVAQNFGGRSIALILTGMGQDGLRGAEEMKKRGALILAQDRTSSVVWGMPGAIVEAGLACGVLDLDAIAPTLMRQEYSV